MNPERFPTTGAVASAKITLRLTHAWTNELELAFKTLIPFTKVRFGIFYGQLKRDPLWDPIRKDPRYEKLLAELAPRD